MSMQQINLLNPQLLTPQVAFSSRTIAWMLLAVVSLGLALYVWVIAGARGIRTQMDEAQTTRDALQARIDAADQPSADGMTEADKHAQALAAAKRRIAQLKTLQAALGTVHGEAGFSAKLRALANEGLPGVWLTGIEFDQAGFHLEGRALQPSRIPDYLALLSRQPALGTLALSGFSIVPPDAPESGQTPEPGVAFSINPAAGSAQP